MSFQQDVLLVAQAIHQEIEDNNFSNNLNDRNDNVMQSLFKELITNKSLQSKTEKLFFDGHYARAVEEAYKFLDNFVKKKAGLHNSELTGAALMNNVFSSKNPKLKLNEGKSSSEQNEQLGYMQIYAGCMTGIRNPRAHDSNWKDGETQALQLLVLANHLIDRVQMAQVVQDKLE